MRGHANLCGMAQWTRRGLAAVVAALILAGIVAIVVRSDEPARVAASTTTSTAASATTTTTVATSTTATVTTSTTAPRVPWPAIRADGTARAVTTPNGVVLAVLSSSGAGRYLARSPCGREVSVTGTALAGATVVLDPGHGGDEPGAVGPGGATEKDVNLAIARFTSFSVAPPGPTAPGSSPP